MRSITLEKFNHRARRGLLLPERSLRAAAQKQNARPARIGVDEGCITREIKFGIVAAQDHPFDQLAASRIVDVARDRRRFVKPAFVHEINCLLDRGDVERRGRCARGRRELRGASRRSGGKCGRGRIVPREPGRLNRGSGKNVRRRRRERYRRARRLDRRNVRGELCRPVRFERRSWPRQRHRLLAPAPRSRRRPARRLRQMRL